jgi:hypothetical protein
LNFSYILLVFIPLRRFLRKKGSGDAAYYPGKRETPIRRIQLPVCKIKMTKNILHFILEMQFSRHKREIGNILFLSELRDRDTKKEKNHIFSLLFSEMVSDPFQVQEDITGRIGALFHFLEMHQKSNPLVSMVGYSRYSAKRQRLAPWSGCLMPPVSGYTKKHVYSSRSNW